MEVIDVEAMVIDEEGNKKSRPFPRKEIHINTKEIKNAVYILIIVIGFLIINWIITSAIPWIMKVI